jgi:dihydrodipicolinate synthase/N-acetylneuraminate lyase
MAVNWQDVYPAVTTQYDHLSINFDATLKMIDTIIKEGVELSKFNLD